MPLVIVGGLETIIGMVIVLCFPGFKAVGYFLSELGCGGSRGSGAVWECSRQPFSGRVWLGRLCAGATAGHFSGDCACGFAKLPAGGSAWRDRANSSLVLGLLSIALFTSRWWHQSASVKQVAVPRGLRSHVLWVTILIFIQLLIAATMRHQHAGLAITDFPLAYGKLWPDTSARAIASYNAHRMELNGENPITAFQVNLQMVHRFVAYTIFLGVAAAAMLARKKLGGSDALTKLAFAWLGLLTVQIALGAATIWTNKAADVATAHVMVGALALLTGSLWYLVATRRTGLAEK